MKDIIWYSEIEIQCLIFASCSYTLCLLITTVDKPAEPQRPWDFLCMFVGDTCLSTGLNPEHKLPQCLLLVSVLGQLPSQPDEVLQLWYTGSQFSEETPR